MSNRTFLANKAIASAWLNEQQLVREGKGTRDWTPEQQQDILDRGKAHDDNGKAFEGHHMKSAEKFPEYQGDPENIQFLSRPEHFAAHNGNFQNPTNGYFNPYTGETKDFGLNKYYPHEIIELSEPVTNVLSKAPDETEITQKSINNNERAADAGINDIKSVDNTSQNANVANTDNDVTKPSNLKRPLNNGSGGGFGRFVGKAVEFCVRHKTEIIVGAEAIVPFLVMLATGGKNSSDSNSSSSNYTPSTNGDSSNNIAEEGDTASVESSENTGRTSPRKHTVPAHRQRYNGKWKDKEPYPRGKNKDD